VFDVDDPFDQLIGAMPDVGLIDGNTSGPDNRPIGEPIQLFTGTTGMDGKATVTLTVSMQPGNNYRAAAATSLADIDVATQDKADSLSASFESPTGTWRPNGNFNGYFPCATVWSPLLTVWRKLHVEVDSMSAEPTTQSERSPDWDWFDAITVSSGQATTIFTGLGSGFQGGLAAGEVDHYEGGTLSYTTPARVFPIRFNQSVLVNGENRAEIRADGTISPAEEPQILQNIGDVRDDDPASGQFPFFYSVSTDPFIRAAYEPAYIKIEQNDALNPNRLVPFDPHLEDFELQTGVGYDNAQDVFSENALWASLVVMGYQPTGALDADPDPFSGSNNSGPASNPYYDEGFEFGVTPEDSDNASVIYVEVHRDVGSAPASPVMHDLSHTIAHEIGHSGGPANNGNTEHDEGGLMRPGAPASECCFSALTIRRFREANKW
jgi:hypothetical protein